MEQMIPGLSKQKEFTKRRIISIIFYLSANVVMFFFWSMKDFKTGMIIEMLCIFLISLFVISWEQYYIFI